MERKGGLSRLDCVRPWEKSASWSQSSEGLKDRNFTQQATSLPKLAPWGFKSPGPLRCQTQGISKGPGVESRRTQACGRVLIAGTKSKFVAAKIGGWARRCGGPSRDVCYREQDQKMGLPYPQRRCMCKFSLLYFSLFA